MLVSGATGFVGSALVNKLLTLQNVSVIAGGRCNKASYPAGVIGLLMPDLSSLNETLSLEGIDVLVHTAAKVHSMADDSESLLTDFRKVNVDGTLNLARQAANAGVRRFIFISSIKVNGEETQLGYPFSPDAAAAPMDPYGVSKMEAEQVLLKLAMQTEMEVVIIRPVLVYGPNVKANFMNMLRWLRKGVPLPFGAIHNKRSLVSLDNLVDLIITCLAHPAAVNQTFLVSDGEDLSTTELLRRMSAALCVPARLIPVPRWMLMLAATLLGKQALSQRLCGSLQVDISKTIELLDWAPPVSVDEALRKTAHYFVNEQNN